MTFLAKKMHAPPQILIFQPRLMSYVSYQHPLYNFYVLLCATYQNILYTPQEKGHEPPSFLYVQTLKIGGYKIG